MAGNGGTHEERFALLSIWVFLLSSFPSSVASCLDSFVSFFVLYNGRSVLHRSRRYCNTGSMRGADGASPISDSLFEKSI